jgi:plasmid stability protein
MQYACLYVYCMKKNIQIRNVPEDLHRTLKSRAALAGMSLSDYLLQEARKLAERPTLEELRQRLHHRQPVANAINAAELIRKTRGPLPNEPVE